MHNFVRPERTGTVRAWQALKNFPDILRIGVVDPDSSGVVIIPLSCPWILVPETSAMQSCGDANRYMPWPVHKQYSTIHTTGDHRCNSGSAHRPEAWFWEGMWGSDFTCLRKSILEEDRSKAAHQDAKNGTRTLGAA